MRYIISLFVFIFCINCGVYAQYRGTLKTVNINDQSLRNNLFDEPNNREVKVYLPPSYDEVNYAFPVIYFLQGYGCTWIELDQFLGGYEESLEDETSEEMIVIIISGCNTLFGSFFVNSIVNGNWEDFVTKDIVNYIDLHYRTLAKSQCRGIAGHSMGGYGALHVGLNNPDVFNSMYILAPELFDENGMVDGLLFWDENLIKDFIFYLDELKSENHQAEMVNLISTFSNQSLIIQYTLAYGAAFAPDTSGHVPYITFPYSIDEDQNLLLNDSLWSLWDSGCGQLGKKVVQWEESMRSMDTLILGYGVNDIYPSNRTGVVKLHNIMVDQGIKHTLIAYPGGHQDYTRYRDNMFPAFSKTLTRDSSRYRTGANILSFVLDQQIEASIIDTINLTVDAYVYDTTNIEALIPQISISEGARMVPPIGTEVDFSFGPLYYRITSGDGLTEKLWTVRANIRGLGINNDKIINKPIVFFPNPTSHIINLTGLTQPAEVKFYSIQGQLVKTVQQVTSTIDISDLLIGVYILNLKSGSNTIVKKMVVKK